MIKFDLVIRNVFVTYTTYLPITTYNLEHDIPWNIPADSTTFLCFRKRLSREKNGAYVPKDRTSQLVSSEFTDPCPAFRLQAKNLLNRRIYVSF